MPNATPEFKQQLQTAFQELRVGQSFTFRRTFTDGDVALFCGVTGDYNPYHIDDTFAGKSWYGCRIIPGLLTASLLTHIGGLLGFLATEMLFQYIAPVYIGDTVTCTITIIEKDEVKRLIRGTGSFVNQDGVEVLKARFSGFPGLVRLAR
ncbi:MAG: MaoC family dehydratase [Nitrospira sp.]|nr:MaoC family dehydratase [Nitrospira sp.]